MLTWFLRAARAGVGLSMANMKTERPEAVERDLHRLFDDYARGLAREALAGA